MIINYNTEGKVLILKEKKFIQCACCHYYKLETSFTSDSRRKLKKDPYCKECKSTKWQNYKGRRKSKKSLSLEKKLSFC